MRVLLNSPVFNDQSNIFIHSNYLYSTSSSPLLLRGAPDYSTDTVSEFHAKVPQATGREGLGKGPYVAARAGFEPKTLQTKGTESTNEPPIYNIDTQGVPGVINQCHF